MAAQLSCSFSSHSNSTCDFSARFPGKNEFFPLSFCTKDIKFVSHLQILLIAYPVNWVHFAGQYDDNCLHLVTEKLQQETEKKFFDHLLCTQGKR